MGCGLVILFCSWAEGEGRRGVLVFCWVRFADLGVYVFSGWVWRKWVGRGFGVGFERGSVRRGYLGFVLGS